VPVEGHDGGGIAWSRKKEEEIGGIALGKYIWSQTKTPGSLLESSHERIASERKLHEKARIR